MQKKTFGVLIPVPEKCQELPEKFQLKLLTGFSIASQFASAQNELQRLFATLDLTGKFRCTIDHPSDHASPRSMKNEDHRQKCRGVSVDGNHSPAPDIRQKFPRITAYSECAWSKPENKS